MTTKEVITNDKFSGYLDKFSAILLNIWDKKGEYEPYVGTKERVKLIL